MFRVIFFIFVQALSGASSDTIVTVTPQQPFDHMQNNGTTLVLKSPRSDASLAISSSFENNGPLYLKVNRRGTVNPIVQTQIQFTPFENHYLCKVSASSHNGANFQEYAQLEFHAKSKNLSNYQLQADADNETIECRYDLPQDIHGKCYSLCIDIIWSIIPQFALSCKEYYAEHVETTNTKIHFHLVYRADALTPKIMNCL